MSEEELRISELRNFLKQKLPEYMIPSSLVVLEAFPLMPNGKVDRKKLLLPDSTRPPLTEEFASPRTEIEELIAQAWREVLKNENIGIYDNFFELGGHSLLATQIVGRLQEAFNKEVPLRVLFDAPTIAELAQELETIIRDGHVPELPPIVSVPRDGPLPLSMNQEHLWHLDQMMPGTHIFNMPYVYQLTGDLNVDALERSLKEIIRRMKPLGPYLTLLAVALSKLSNMDWTFNYRISILEDIQPMMLLSSLLTMCQTSGWRLSIWRRRPFSELHCVGCGRRDPYCWSQRTTLFVIICQCECFVWSCDLYMRCSRMGLNLRC